MPSTREESQGLLECRPLLFWFPFRLRVTRPKRCPINLAIVDFIILLVLETEVKACMEVLVILLLLLVGRNVLPNVVAMLFFVVVVLVLVVVVLSTWSSLFPAKRLPRITTTKLANTHTHARTHARQEVTDRPTDCVCGLVLLETLYSEQLLLSLELSGRGKEDILWVKLGS